MRTDIQVFEDGLATRRYDGNPYSDWWGNIGDTEKYIASLQAKGYDVTHCQRRALASANTEGTETEWNTLIAEAVLRE